MAATTKRGQEYERMRGEYLSLVASIEYNLTLYLAEIVEVNKHHSEFLQWFTRAPIPFSSKVSLFDSIIEDWVMPAQFDGIIGELKESYRFRNTLAHSFRSFDRTLTARGREIPSEQVTFKGLKQRLERVRRLDSLLLGLLVDYLEGPPVPIFADDFADWPL